ncbi:MAG: NAD(P)/FAD-dependent oxidoreductase [Ktedonobacterales bacterium]|nr:NAD(P)/FAD-dependent oxidoreductase [Ktedonobacterales bacterium]
MQPERTLDYLIIGGGLAGATAAEAIRGRDKNGTILIVTNDTALPYHRPPLSKEYLRAEVNDTGTYGDGGVYVQLPDWYDANGVEVLREVSATGLDAAAKTVTLDDGQVIGFGKLLLATGGSPRTLSIPGAQLAGVQVLRSLADADAIREALAPGQRVVVVGSGFIGLETAASALQKGCTVTIVEPQARAWPNMVSPAVSEFFQSQFTAHGATLRYGYAVVAFGEAQDDRVGAVRIAKGDDMSQTEEIPCDLVIMGVGIQLNTQLAQNGGLTIDPKHGIVVNEQLETAQVGIFAAGDAAAYPDPVLGRMHFEHWDHAIASGQTAGSNMAGGNEPYQHVPYFFSDQFDLSLNMLGYPSADAHITLRGDPSAKKFTALYVQDSTLRAALMVNDDAQMDQLRDLIQRGAKLTGGAAALADPARDYGEVFKG